MIHQISFNELSTLLLDFVDAPDGFLFLRMVGTETVVNAIWARLSAKDSRGKKWGSNVQIPIPGQSHPHYVAAQKRVSYRTLRTKLPSGMIDLAMIHPVLTVAEDTARGFHLLSYEPGLPPGFFERLNKTLTVPLQPDWADWLWQAGQQPQARLILDTRQLYEGGQAVEKTELVETSEQPIQRLSSLGQVNCYAIRCDGRYRGAWLQIIRSQLQLGIRLKKVSQPGDRQHYVSHPWLIKLANEGWALYRDQELLTEAPSLNYLLTAARDSLGLYFIIQEDES